MKKLRRFCILLIVLLYLCAIFPAFMSIYNRPVLIGGIPLFVVGILAISALLLLVVFILYRNEERE